MVKQKFKIIIGPGCNTSPWGPFIVGILTNSFDSIDFWYMYLKDLVLVWNLIKSFIDYFIQLFIIWLHGLQVFNPFKHYVKHISCTRINNKQTNLHWLWFAATFSDEDSKNKILASSVFKSDWSAPIASLS